MKKFLLFSLMAIAAMTATAQVVDFEELTLSENTAWTGSLETNKFTSKFLTLYNNYNEDYGYGVWDGFAYTNQTDSTSRDWTNLAAKAGSGNNNSHNYVTAYIPMDYLTDYSPMPISVKIDTTQAGNFTNRGAYFCLPTQVSLYVDDCYAANNFYFTVIAKAYKNGNQLAETEIIMADFRNGNRYKMDAWTFVSLSWLQNADSLTFTIDSNDSGEYGVNTPAYFCMDDFGAERPTTFAQNNSIKSQNTLSAFTDQNGNINLNCSEKIVEINVYDLNGRLLQNKTTNNNNVILELNAKGILLVSAKTESGVQSIKIAK